MTLAEQNERDIERIIHAFTDCSSEFVGLNRYHVYASELPQLERIKTAIVNANCSANFEPIFVSGLVAMEVSTPRIIIDC
jgi:hypothetical protein